MPKSWSGEGRNGCELPPLPLPLPLGAFLPKELGLLFLFSPFPPWELLPWELLFLWYEKGCFDLAPDTRERGSSL